MKEENGEPNRAIEILTKFEDTKWVILNLAVRNEPEVEDPEPLAERGFSGRLLSSCVTRFQIAL
jgi:hypothetical protein